MSERFFQPVKIFYPEEVMKSLRHIFVFIIIFLMLIPLACKEDPRKDCKTAKPSSTVYKNIFKLSYYDTGNIADFVAKKVFIYNDLSADIIYEISDKTIEKGDEEEPPKNFISKETIAKAIDNYNEKQIYSADNNKLFKQGNRVLYLDADSIKEEIVGDATETTNIILSVYITNLSYVCSYYKLMPLKDYIEAEELKSGAAKDKAYRNFIDTNEKKVSIDGMENPENYGVFILDGGTYSPSTEIEFTFENKILAYYSPKNKNCKISGSSLTITPENSSSVIAVMYQIKGTLPVNWNILGPVIGVVSVFLIILSIKIIKTAKKKKTLKGR